MRKTLYMLLSFSFLALMQIAAPISMIVRREMTLRDGQQFRFRTAPVDPYDAFRGRYVALRMEQDEVPLPYGMKLERGQKVFARIEEDDKGYAKVAELTLERPQESPYVIAKVRWLPGNVVHLNLPFNRYYMDENAAPAAERVYREYTRSGSQDAYVTVKLKNGFAVLEELYVGGRPISEVVRAEQ